MQSEVTHQRSDEPAPQPCRGMALGSPRGNGSRFRRAAGRAPGLRARRRADRTVRDLVAGLRVDATPAAGARHGRRDADPAADLRADAAGHHHRSRRGHARHRLGEPAPVRAAPQRGAGGRPADRRAGAVGRHRRSTRSSSTPRWSAPGPGTGWWAGSRCGSAAAGWPARARRRSWRWSAVTGLTLTDRQGTARRCSPCWRRCGPPTSPRRWPSCRRNAATRWPTRWTTSGWPTSSRSCPRTTRRALVAHLERGPRRGRAGGDGPRRRGRPAGGAARRRRRPAARADGARGVGPGAAAAAVRRRHRRRPDDPGAGRAAPRTRRSPRRWPGSATPTSRPRWPAWCSSAARRRPPRPARYLGCVHTQRLLREPPFELVGGRRRHRDGHAVAGRGAGRASPGSSPPTTWWRAGGGRRGAPARRGHRRRRAGPPAARRLAGPPERPRRTGDARSA